MKNEEEEDEEKKEEEQEEQEDHQAHEETEYYTATIHVYFYVLIGRSSSAVMFQSFSRPSIILHAYFFTKIIHSFIKFE